MAKNLIENKIRQLRFENGQMTQSELASNVGVTRQTILSLEAGRDSPSLELAFKSAQAFQMPLEEVFQYPSN